MKRHPKIKPVSIKSVLEELIRSGSDVSVIVHTRYWNAIPLLIREWDGKDEATMMRLLDEMSRILTLVSDSEVAVANKRLLHSSLSVLSQTPTLPKKIHTRAGQCHFLLDSVPDGPFMLLGTEEFRRMEQSLSELNKRSSEMTKHEKELEVRIAVLLQDVETLRRDGAAKGETIEQTKKALKAAEERERGREKASRQNRRRE
ncbi:hypothetical protein BLNAU_15925 [Blattamonas nauphoetae]|uniref:Uncharacterized protein n=1 Tax=Blattamonas nauphoetae TaxID=2049346 RepID=A0ABQ9XCU7_9EUKA|nr:hypothetical protein BLNAU_15925 [Blattamonas nauphoetae]